MRVLAVAIAFVLGVALAFGFVHRRVRTVPRDQALVELLHTKSAVERSLRHKQTVLLEQLEAFAQLVSADRDFAMKLVVEQDRSAPEVSQVAARYMPAMALSLLEVSDSTGTLLSSGHFPASAGNSAAEKLALIDTTAVFLDDLVRGRQELTLQAGVNVMLGDAARITCSGGWMVDEGFLEELTPHPGVRLMLRHGELYRGIDSVSAVSPITDNQMIVNDVTYLATSLAIPYRGDGVAPELIILADLPAPLSLF